MPTADFGSEFKGLPRDHELVDRPPGKAHISSSEQRSKRQGPQRIAEVGYGARATLQESLLVPAFR
jgi:hypothetical protein